VERLNAVCGSVARGHLDHCSERHVLLETRPDSRGVDMYERRVLEGARCRDGDEGERDPLRDVLLDSV